MSCGPGDASGEPSRDGRPCQVLVLTPVPAEAALGLWNLGESPGVAPGVQLDVQPDGPVEVCGTSSGAAWTGPLGDGETSGGSGSLGGQEGASPPARRSGASALAEAERDERRKARNRRSNRNFRERQKRLIAALEEESRALRDSMYMLEARNERLRRENSVLRLCHQQGMGFSSEGVAIAHLLPHPTQDDAGR